MHDATFPPATRTPLREPPGDLKLQVNAWLWTLLPGDMTLDEAEEVAGQVCACLYRAWTGGAEEVELSHGEVPDAD